MVSRVFADLGLAYGLRAQLRMVCPELFDPLKPDNKGELAMIKWWATNQGIRALYELKIANGPSHSGSEILRLGDLGDLAQLPYPSNKTRTKEHVEAMQSTKGKLDTLREKYDEHLKKYLKPQDHNLLQGAMPSRGDLPRTPDWSEAEVSVPQSAKLSEYIPPPSVSEDDKFTLPIRKEKPKTRGQTMTASAYEQHEVPSPTRDMLHFTLSKMPHQTFSDLFYKPTTSSQPGEIPWTDFVSAMSAIGFQAEKLYGFVWRFTPKNIDTLGTETPINFHEPNAL